MAGGTVQDALSQAMAQGQATPGQGISQAPGAGMKFGQGMANSGLARYLQPGMGAVQRQQFTPQTYMPQSQINMGGATGQYPSTGRQTNQSPGLGGSALAGLGLGALGYGLGTGAVQSGVSGLLGSLGIGGSAAASAATPSAVYGGTMPVATTLAPLGEAGAAGEAATTAASAGEAGGLASAAPFLPFAIAAYNILGPGQPTDYGLGNASASLFGDGYINKVDPVIQAESEALAKNDPEAFARKYGGGWNPMDRA